MKKIAFFTLLITIFISCKDDAKSGNMPVTTSVSQVMTDSLTLKLDSLYAIGRIQGFSVAISDSAGILYTKGFGKMDIEHDKDYTENTIHNIASISKTFIGIALMKAQEQGALKLDDPINDYLPFLVVNPHFPLDTITIRQLASHTSGIRDTDVYDQKSYVLKEVTEDSLLTVVEESLNPPDSKIPFLEFLPKVLVEGGEYYSEDAFLKHRPGDRFEYSNIGATLAALVLEMATEVPFDQFSREHILLPLGMQASGWSFGAVDMQQHSRLYAEASAEIPLYELITYPDGGMRSSANDMALYLTELIRGYQGNGKLLSDSSYKEYFTPVLSDSHFEEERDDEFPYNDEFNMGVFMGHTGIGTIGHTGGDPGVTTLMFFNPDNGLGQYIMINTSLTDEAGVKQLFGSMLALEEYAGELRN